MSHQLIDIEGAGPVRLERSARARRLSISVRPHACARVAVPYGCSFDAARRFARSMMRWLQRQQRRLRELERTRDALTSLPPPMERAAAAHQLLARVQCLAATHGLAYRRVSFREQRTVWGSCSVRNDLSINLKLTRLAPALIDYVLLHELVHTRVKHHRAAFWSELQRHLPHARALAARLRQYSLHLL